MSQQALYEEAFRAKLRDAVDGDMFVVPMRIAPVRDVTGPSIAVPTNELGDFAAAARAVGAEHARVAFVMVGCVEFAPLQPRQRQQPPPLPRQQQQQQQ